MQRRDRRTSTKLLQDHRSQAETTAPCSPNRSGAPLSSPERHCSVRHVRCISSGVRLAEVGGFGVRSEHCVQGEKRGGRPCPALSTRRWAAPQRPAADRPATPSCGRDPSARGASHTLLRCDSCPMVKSPQDDGSALGHTPGASSKHQELASACPAPSQQTLFFLSFPPVRAEVAFEHVTVRTKWPDNSQGL